MALRSAVDLLLEASALTDLRRLSAVPAEQVGTGGGPHLQCPVSLLLDPLFPGAVASCQAREVAWGQGGQGTQGGLGWVVIQLASWRPLLGTLFSLEGAQPPSQSGQVHPVHGKPTQMLGSLEDPPRSGAPQAGFGRDPAESQGSSKFVCFSELLPLCKKGA